MPLLKLPDQLPPLEEPHFILANPEWLQLGVVVLLLLFAPLASLIWVGALVLAGTAESVHYAVLAVMTLLLIAGFHPRNRRRWVSFAADPRGIWLGTYQGRFHHVPWSQVGPSSIGVAGIGSNRQHTVILPLKVDETIWAALLGGRKRRVNAPADEAGYRPFGIDNAARNVEETRRQIERIRGFRNE